jgi:hypothetical protein
MNRNIYWTAFVLSHSGKIHLSIPNLGGAMAATERALLLPAEYLAIERQALNQRYNSQQVALVKEAQ